MQRRPRQDPVSCQLCRSKKLKCNREYPCSNCTARGITCRSPSGVNVVTTTATRPAATATDQDTFNQDVLRRIERLEARILPGEGEANDGLRRSSARIPVTEALTQPTPEDERVRDEETRELENVGTRENDLLMNLSDNLAFEICSLSVLLDKASVSSNSIVVALPDYDKAVELYEYYRIHVDHTVRVLHMPTLRRMLDHIYATLNTDQPVQSCQAALLLAVFAMSAYFSMSGSACHFVVCDNQQSLLLAKVLSKGALDLLDFSRRATSGSLEDAQASILMSFVLYHFDGLSARGRQLTTSAIVIGRDLHLHRLDERETPDSEFTPEQLLDREIKRRVWWHATSTDWILASFSGPQDVGLLLLRLITGAYFVHPKHMQVRLPNECSDEELSKGLTSTSSPSPAQQYFLQRIKLAQLCREIIDTLTLSSKVLQVDYNQVKAIDQKILDSTPSTDASTHQSSLVVAVELIRSLATDLSDLPPILRITDSSHYSLKLTDQTSEVIIGLRYYVNTSAHGRRCKLHQPFLIRQSLDSRFAYSRNACLDSARTVFRLQQELDQRISFPGPGQARRLGTKTHFMQLATVVMIMDLCFNRDNADEQERKQEVKEALKVFERAAKVAPLARIVMNSLMQMLRKHEIDLSDVDVPEPVLSETPAGRAADTDGRGLSRTMPNIIQGADLHEQTEHISPTIMTPPDTMPTIASTWSDLDASSLDQFWQTAMQGTGDDTLQWDHFFSDLDTRMI